VKGHLTRASRSPLAFLIESGRRRQTGRSIPAVTTTRVVRPYASAQRLTRPITLLILPRQTVSYHPPIPHFVCLSPAPGGTRRGCSRAPAGGGLPGEWCSGEGEQGPGDGGSDEGGDHAAPQEQQPERGEGEEPVLPQVDQRQGERDRGARDRADGGCSGAGKERLDARGVTEPVEVPSAEEVFETGLVMSLRVDRYAQVSVRTNRYSAPARLIGRKVRVMLHASELIVYDGQEEIARHERLLAKGGARLELDHYLEVLIRKPGALPGATALEQARAAGKFTPVHDSWWAAACKAHGDRDGTRALIEVLLLGRHMNHEHLVAGLAVALRAGALTADAVALEARKAAEADRPEAAGQPEHLAEPDTATVTFLTERRMAHLPPDNRPLPSVAVYDQLLRRPRAGAERPAEGESP
jgi:hypothetical protein